MEQQYIAEKKVLGVEKVEEQTPAKNEMVKVLFEDSSVEIMPKMRFDIIVTNKISDASTVQKTLKEKVSATLYGALHEYGVKYGEADEIINYAADLVNVGYEAARDIIWGFEHRFLPLNEINKVLVKNNAKQSNNGVGSEGGGADIVNSK